MYTILNKSEGIPKLFYASNEGDFNVIVIELLGPNIQDLLELCKNKFSIFTGFSLAIQMVNCFQ